jgi:hypothetical protein
MNLRGKKTTYVMNNADGKIDTGLEWRAWALLK